MACNSWSHCPFILCVLLCVCVCVCVYVCAPPSLCFSLSPLSQSLPISPSVSLSLIFSHSSPSVSHARSLSRSLSFSLSICVCMFAPVGAEPRVQAYRQRRHTRKQKPHTCCPQVRCHTFATIPFCRTSVNKRSYDIWPGAPVFRVVNTMQYARRRLGMI